MAASIPTEVQRLFNRLTSSTGVDYDFGPELSQLLNQGL